MAEEYAVRPTINFDAKFSFSSLAVRSSANYFPRANIAEYLSHELQVGVIEVIV
jgi:hypothetical protein